MMVYVITLTIFRNSEVKEVILIKNLDEQALFFCYNKFCFKILC